MLEYSGIPGPLRLSNIGRAVNPWLRSTTEVQHLRVNKGAADLSIVDVGVFKFPRVKFKFKGPSKCASGGGFKLDPSSAPVKAWWQQYINKEPRRHVQVCQSSVSASHGEYSKLQVKTTSTVRISWCQCRYLRDVPQWCVTRQPIHPFVYLHDWRSASSLQHGLGGSTAVYLCQWPRKYIHTSGQNARTNRLDFVIRSRCPTDAMR